MFFFKFSTIKISTIIPSPWGIIRDNAAFSYLNNSFSYFHIFICLNYTFRQYASIPSLFAPLPWRSDRWGSSARGVLSPPIRSQRFSLLRKSCVEFTFFDYGPIIEGVECGEVGSDFVRELAPLDVALAHQLQRKSLGVARRRRRPFLVITRPLFCCGAILVGIFNFLKIVLKII